MAVNGRGQRLSQEIEDALLLLGEFFALLDVLAGNGRGVLGPSVDQVVGEKDSLEGTGSVAALLARKTTENCHDLNVKKIVKTQCFQLGQLCCIVLMREVAFSSGRFERRQS